MIQFIKRKKLDVDKYDACIENSMQSDIYGYSWYLDAVCKNWSVFVLNDYEAVMPVPWKRKFFVKYTYKPLWTPQLGIYSKVVEDENEFLIELCSEFKYVNMRMNFKNAFSMFQPNQIEKKLQFLILDTSHKNTHSAYKKEIRKDLAKAVKNNLTTKWTNDVEEFILLYKADLGEKAKKLKLEYFETLLGLMKLTISKNYGEIVSVFDDSGKVISSAFFIKYRKRVTLLISSSDLKNKEGAFLVNEAVKKYYADYSFFVFENSNKTDLSLFFKSFGAKEKSYIELHYNRLPWLLRLFKKQFN